MRWSWKIGEIAGIGLYVHSTFWLLIAFVLFLNWSDGSSLTKALYGAAFVLVIFGCITLHELGHALTARHFGVRTRDITLLPIGGLARLERMPDDPIQELWVALGGPAVNIAIAGLLYIVLLASGGVILPGQFLSLGGSFLADLLVVNLWLVAFNMIPAFPMDGGRVLRALLAMRLDLERATWISARVGQGIAFALGVGCLFGLAGIFSSAGFIRLDGLFSDPFLILIALFVWTGARQEAAASRMHVPAGNIAVQNVMLRDVHTLRPDDTLGDAVNQVLSGWREDFPVVFGDHVLGMLTREDMTRSLAQTGPETRVRESMRRDIATVDPRLKLEQALVMIRECNCRSLPVIYEGQLVGLLTLDNVGEFLSIHAALRQAGRKSRGKADAEPPSPDTML
ncbi:MAG: site-2 protease family protein [Acidobacteria bacterium]|nr:MAG: site-2 protease family protein [Acidobacteriota bacterium]